MLSSHGYSGSEFTPMQIGRGEFLAVSAVKPATP
jgi:hypothetical protein